MTISREKCLEMAQEAGFAYEGSGDGLYICNTCDIEDLINHAYAEGQKDMLERAAKEIEKYVMLAGFKTTLIDALENLEIE